MIIKNNLIRPIKINGNALYNFDLIKLTPK